MSWPLVRFEELYSEPSRNGVYKPKQFHGSGVRIVNMGELFAYDIIADQEMKRLAMTDAEMARSGLADGDLLFGRRSLVEAGAGKCSLVEGLSEATTFESSIIRVRVDQDRLRPRFIYYWLKSHVGRGKIRAIVTGTNVKGIKASVLKHVQVPCPTTEAQDLIVDRLRAYDDLIENNLRRIQLLEQAARLLYKDWFVHFRFPGHKHVKIIDGVPEGWELKTLGDVVEVTKGKNITKGSAKDGSVPVVAGGLSPAYNHDTANAIAPVITVSASGANAGYVNLYHEDIWASDCSYISRTSTDSLYYLYLLLTSKQKEIFGFQRGAAQPHVYPNDLKRLPLLVPMESIVRLFEESVSHNFLQVKGLLEQNKLLTQARNLLLPRLMNGEITV